MSMNPGATTRSVTSTVRLAGSSILPTATMRPSRTPTSAATPVRPVPSTTVPPLRIRSSITGSCSSFDPPTAWYLDVAAVEAGHRHASEQAHGPVELGAEDREDAVDAGLAEGAE